MYAQNFAHNWASGASFNEFLIMSFSPEKKTTECKKICLADFEDKTANLEDRTANFEERTANFEDRTGQTAVSPGGHMDVHNH